MFGEKMEAIATGVRSKKELLEIAKRIEVSELTI